LVIFSLARSKRANTIPAAVGAYIGAAYFFTSSASFANPGDQRGADVLQHVRRESPCVAAGYSGGAADPAAPVRSSLSGSSYPDVTPAEARRGPPAHHETGAAGQVSQPLPSQALTMATVLFVCLHNAGRSQMSQALFERAAAGKHTALSAAPPPPSTSTPR